MTLLFVDKPSGTLTDPLVLFGLVPLLLEIGARTRGGRASTLQLRDAGSHYVVETDLPLDRQRLTGLRGPYTPLRVIRTVKNAATLPRDIPDSSIIDYEQERNKRQIYFEIQKKLSDDAKLALRAGQPHAELDFLRAAAPHPDWDVFRAINPAALPGYNKLVLQWWAVQSSLAEVLALILDLFASSPNDVASAMAAWDRVAKAHKWNIKATTSAVQLYNPSQGKGQNRAKGDRLVMDNVKDAFWLLEYLKAVGFYEAAVTKQLRDSKDRKTYVLAPRKLDYETHRETMQRFRPLLMRAETPIRSDVLAVLKYTRVLLNYAEEPEGSAFMLLMGQAGPSSLVSGFHSAFYKDLGNATATMNISFMALPAWLPAGTTTQVQHALEIVREHEAVIRQFEEKHSDDYELLLRYRDFLSGQDLRPFLEFTTAYSSYLISHNERRGVPARPFRVTTMRRLVMNVAPTLSEILESPGFQNVAYAIRWSTVIPQQQKAWAAQNRGQKPLYDIRYGLGLQLARKSAYREDFMKALADFLIEYEAETLQVQELLARRHPQGIPDAVRRRMRRGVRTSDLAEVTRLIDIFKGDSELIGKMLIAFGYCLPSSSSTGETLPTDSDLDEVAEADGGADADAETDEN